MELNICHLYPDVLNLYGDRGNIACMKKRLEWRGIGCTVTELPLGTKDDLTGYDLFFIGGGQDFEQTVLLADLRAGRAGDIRAAAEREDLRLSFVSQYYVSDQNRRPHVLVMNYSGLEERQIPEAVARLCRAVEG